MISSVMCLCKDYCNRIGNVVLAYVCLRLLYVASAICILQLPTQLVCYLHVKVALFVPN